MRHKTQAELSYGRAYYARNRERIRAQTATRNHGLRKAALDAYGGRCNCCGEARFEFLAIDHIGGGGLAHRKQINRATLSLWLKQQGYPDGFRVLCHNCNLALGFYGACPHGKLEMLGTPVPPEEGQV